MQRLPAITHARFSLIRFRSPLLTESRLFSLPAGTEMFHFPAFPPHALCVQAWVTGHVSCRVSPFGNPRIKARLTAPRGLSQPPTSFIGSWCQGIHRVPLITWPQRCSRPLCSSQITGGPVPQPSRTPTNRDAVRRRNGPIAPTDPTTQSEDREDGSESPEEAVAPSGPNSVPKPTLTTTHRSNPPKEGRTGLGDNERRPNGQCSTP